MKMEMTPELFALVEEGAKFAREEGNRDAYDGHKWAHCVAERLPDELIKARMPSESDTRERLAGWLVRQAINASKRRPRLHNTLLKACEMQEVIPDELMELPGKKIVPRGQLYADEQWFLATKCKADASSSADKARYESHLGKAFLKWRDQELAKGRPAAHLTQMMFWMECGHIAKMAA